MLQLRAAYVPPIVARPAVRALIDAKREDFRASVVRTMDDILASCPTDKEIEAIRKDFLFTFDAKPETLKCTAGGTETGILLSLYNAFRCMKALTFDKPIPVIGAKNIYQWLKASGIGVHVIDDPDAFSTAGKSSNIRRNVIEGPWTRAWDNGRGVGMVSLIGLLVHEGAHSILGKGHDCTQDGLRWDEASATVYRDGIPVKLTPAEAEAALWSWDSSLEYGGAWAAQYWFDRWLADHSGQYLTDDEKRSASNLAESLRTGGSLSCGKLLPRVPGLMVSDRGAILPEVRKPAPSHMLVSTSPSTHIAPQVQMPPETPFFMRVSGAFHLRSPYSVRTGFDYRSSVGASLTAEWTDDDLRELADIAARSRILDPEYLLKVMASESGLHPWAAYRVDSAGKATTDKSGYPFASGLIQLTKAANDHVGITEAERADIPNWSVADQLPLVDRYYSRLPWTKAGRDYDSAAAVYFANFAGSRMMSRGIDPGTVIYSSADGEAYSRNKSFDRAGKGYITVQDLADHLDVVEKSPAYQEALARLREVAGYPEASSTPWWKYALGGLFVAGVGVYAVVK